MAENDTEVITDVSEGGEPGSTRKLRVYDSKGDFIIEIPSDAKVTFGYFNPTPSGDENRRYGRAEDEKRTALRVWKTKDQQLAVFLGVKGFRDEKIKLTRLRERIIVENNVADDGEGNIEFQGKRKRELVASPEPDTYN